MSPVFTLNLPSGFIETLNAVTESVALETLDHLKRQPALNAVVLISATTPNLSTELSLIRTISPRYGLVVVAETTETLSAETLIACDVLLSSASPLEIQARLHTAQYISELKTTVAQAAQQDMTTGLYHQSFYLKRLAEEIALSKRHQSPVTCLIFGISFWDAYRDSYGYDAMTDLLKQVGQSVKALVRQDDIVARMGDNELGVLLPLSSEKGAKILAKRVIQTVSKQDFLLGDQPETISLNAGIAHFPVADEPEADANALVRYTRHALHHARCDEGETHIQLFSELQLMNPFKV
jgi:diguanylate cyclase (GGDEF)-like protein